MQSKFELIVVKNAMAFACDSTNCEILRGDDLFELVQSVYPKGQPLNTYWYQDKWDADNDVTPQSAKDIIALNEQGGTIYLVTYPAAAVAPWVIQAAISVLVSVAVAFLMPRPDIPNAANQPPSPNNALARRVNRERLGGRIADIYGQVWSVPDLIAPVYVFYENHKEVEISYLCIGRGQYDVEQALDDTTPINQVFGSSVLVFNPDKTLEDTPDFLFGSAFTPDEATWTRLAAKRYTSVNGQILSAPDSYLKVKTTFKNPNIIETSENINFKDNFKAGQSILIEGADNLVSANGIIEGVEPDGAVAKYTLNGQYTILEVTANQIKLFSPATVNTDWQKLTDNVDFTVESESVTLSSESEALWQGWFYTDLKDHDGAYVNIVAPNGLYEMGRDPDWRGLRIYGTIESELVDVANNPIAGTLVSQSFSISAPNTESYGWGSISGGADATNGWTKNDKIRQSAAVTISITNPHFVAGKRLRFRISRSSKLVTGDSAVADEIRIKDFYGTRRLTASDYPKGVTTAISKTRATEGALSLKERKLRLLSTRLVKDWRNNDALIASKRIDDIIYHIATDPVTSSLTASDLDMTQISAEVDAQIAYFGTDLAAQFCGTFDNTDITTEEMLQTVAKAGFFTAYRLNNQVHLHFEKPQDYAVANFNSHNITPDSFEYGESFGARKGYDGIEVTYTDPTDDAQVTLKYPSNDFASNPEKIDLVGVRNKPQAHFAAMRAHWKNQLAYSTCEFTGADESGIVIPTNRINVANQNHADTQQGAVESLEVINGQTVPMLSDAVDFGGKTQATIFVQTVSGVVDNIRCYPRDDYSVVLSRAPSQPLSTAWDAVVRATYQFVTHDDLQRDSYIVTAKDVGENPLSHRLTCINYDSRYYQNDSDFINNLIPNEDAP